MLYVYQFIHLYIRGNDERLRKLIICIGSPIFHNPLPTSKPHTTECKRGIERTKA